MSPTLNAVRNGARRGLTETRQALTAPEELFFQIFLAGVIVTVLFFQRDSELEGSPVPLAAFALPGVLGMLIAFTAVSSASFSVAFEREDGTLLRAKAAPTGLVGYLIGTIVKVPAVTLAGLLWILVPGLILIPEVREAGITGWLLALAFALLGLLAAVPIGMALGAVATNPRAVGGFVMFGTAGVVAVSGIFYPITALPGWLASVGQVFPFYWLGLGLRSALLPEAAVAVEIDGAWRGLETVGVLGAWAVVGLLLAPVLLRRMARRVSGATVEAGRIKAAQRVG